MSVVQGSRGFCDTNAHPSGLALSDLGLNNLENMTVSSGERSSKPNCPQYEHMSMYNFATNGSI